VDFDFKFLLQALYGAVKGIPVTLEIALLPVLYGTLIGIPIALLRFFGVKVVSPVFKWAVTAIRGIPVILLLLVFYLTIAGTYDKLMEVLRLPFTFKNLNKVSIVIAALTFAATAYLSEIYRGSLASIRKGQFDAASSVGMTKVQALYRVVIPQAIPVALPMLSNVVIGMLKAAALASFVSVVDVLNGALIEATVNYKYFEAYVAAALVYWAMAVIIERIFIVVEKRTGRKIRASANTGGLSLFAVNRNEGVNAT